MSVSQLNNLGFIPESYLPTAPYIPAHCIPYRTSVDAANLEYELDELGQSSILRLMLLDKFIIPFIDLSNYDTETKSWLWFETASNFPYRYNKKDNTLTCLYLNTIIRISSISPIYFDRDSTQLKRDVIISDNETLTFNIYSPLILTINNEYINDISDYSTFKNNPKLDKVSSTVPEFYYDFNSRIYTNKNLAGSDPSQIKIYYFKVSDNDLKVKCRMSTNLGTVAYYTPKVDHYIIKLKGQSLGL